MSATTEDYEFEDRLARALHSAIDAALRMQGLDSEARPTWRLLVAFDDEQGRSELNLAHHLVDPFDSSRSVAAPPSPDTPEAA